MQGDNTRIIASEIITVWPKEGQVGITCVESKYTTKTQVSMSIKI